MSSGKVIDFENLTGVLVGDGAMGTSLQNKGLPSGEAPEKWNLEQPQKIVEVHKSFIEVGADLIETNTFGGNYIRLKEEGLENRMEKINYRAVELAQKAAQKDTIVAGSVGPTGKMFKPLGVLTPEEALNAYTRQIEVLVEAGVDVIIIETFTALEEIEQALSAAKEVEVPVIAQMSFQENRKTMMGVGIEQFVELAEEYKVSVVGTNCTPGAELTVELIKEFNSWTDLPLSGFPNAGKPELKDGEVYYPEQPEDFAAFVDEFVNNGVKILGGCCGSTPETIRAIAQIISAG
ncbi:MAG: homocysteine S-methyltransferase family protein [Bacillota bacterium]